MGRLRSRQIITRARRPGDGDADRVTNPLGARFTDTLMARCRAFGRTSDILSAGALLVSFVALVLGIVDTQRKSTTEHHRSFYGSYTLGRFYEQVRDQYAGSTAPDSDVKLATAMTRLLPITDALGIQIPFERIGVHELQIQDADENSPADLFHEALVTKYDNGAVAAAFYLGQTVERLSRSYNIHRSDFRRTYAALFETVNALLNELGARSCQRLSAQPLDDASYKSVASIRKCVRELWLAPD